MADSSPDETEPTKRPESPETIIGSGPAPQGAPTPPTAPTPPSGGSQGPPTAPTGSAPAGPPPPPNRPKQTIAGMSVPVAITVAVVAFVVIAAGVAVIAASPWSSSSDDGPDDAAYLEEVSDPLQEMNDAATAVSTALASTTVPADLTQLRQAATAQIATVESARANLAQVEVDGDHADAQDALRDAARVEVLYLTTLSRAAGLPPDDALRLVSRVSAQAESVRQEYQDFLALVPTARDQVTDASLGDVEGLRGALETKRDAALAAAERRKEEARRRAEQKAEEEARRRAEQEQAANAPFSGVTFSSPTGNIACRYHDGDILRCSTGNDQFSVAMESTGAPYDNSANAIESGGETIPYGKSWSRGPFSCDSAVEGFTCVNSSGNGFFLNRDTYNPF